MPLGLFSVVFPNVLFSRDKNIGNGHCPASLTVATHWSVIFSPCDLSWIFPCSLLDCSIAHLQVYLSTWVVAKPTFAAVDWDHVAFAVGKKFKLNQVTFPGGRKTVSQRLWCIGILLNRDASWCGDIWCTWLGSNSIACLSRWKSCCC